MEMALVFIGAAVFLGLNEIASAIRGIKIEVEYKPGRKESTEGKSDGPR